MIKLIDRIRTASTAVLVINMNNGYVSEEAENYIKAGNLLAPRLGKFLNHCRECGITVIYASQIYRSDQADLPENSRTCARHQGKILLDGTWESLIYEACAPEEQEIQIKKQYYNAFYQTELNVILQAMEADTVVITGVCTDVSCFYTAREAFYRNYRVAVLEDLTGTRAWPDFGYGAVTDREQHLAAVNNLAVTSAQIMSSGEFEKYL